MPNIRSRALALLAGLLVLSAPGLGAQAPAAAKIRGDVDGDGRVTEADAQAVRAHLVGRPLPNGASILPAADANGDGRVTAVDAAVISRFVAGGDVGRFPVGKPEPGSETPAAGGAGTGGDLLFAQQCEVDVVAGTLSCSSPAPQTGGARPDLILGTSQVQLVSGGAATVHKLETANEDTTQVPARVRNLIGQPIGTGDGTTVHPDGIRVFFNNGPTVTAVSSGTIAAASVRMENVAGTTTFAPPSGSPVYTNKKYYQYNEMLAQNATTAAQPWLFVYSPNVTRFSYSVFIAAPVQFEQGWITVAPASSSVGIGGTTTLTATVRNEFGTAVGDGVAWSSSNDAVATVDPSTGVVTGVAAGTVTVTATSTVQPARTGTATVTVDLPPSVASTTPTDDATGVAPGSTITIEFSEPVNVTGSAFSLQCPAATPHAFTPSGSGTTYVLTPTAPMPSATVCQVTVSAAEVTDTDAADGPNTMAADYTFDFTVSNALVNDVYPETVIGNVSINSANATPAFSVTANDQIGAGDQVTFFGWGATAGVSAKGGNVSVTASGPGRGQFTYDPPAGYEGADTIKYRVGGAAGDTAYVTLTVTGMAWFIDNNSGACTSACDGRLSHPFTTLAAFQAVNNGSGNNPAPGDFAFLYESSTPYAGPLTLLDTQKVVGQDSNSQLADLMGIPVPSGSSPLPATAPSNPARTIIGGSNGVGLALDNVLLGFAIEPSAGIALSTVAPGTGFGTLLSDITIDATGSAAAMSLANGTVDSNSFFSSVSSTGGAAGISLQNVNGTLAITGGAISGTSAQGLLVNGGSATVSYGGTISNSSGRTVEITSRSAGNVTLSGNLSGGGTGILVNAVTGGTITFSGASKQITTSGTDPAVTLTASTGSTLEFTGGGLVLSTDDGAGLTATGGGTLVLTGAGNSITSTGGIALNVQNTTIGSGGLTLASVNANGGLHGIRLQNSGGGALSVAGGTIQNNTSHGITVVGSSGSHALQNMTLSGGNAGSATVFGSSFGTYNLNGSSITATGGLALCLTTGNLAGTLPTLSSSGSTTNGLYLVSVGGSLAATAGSITGANNSSVAVNGGSLDLAYGGSITHADADSMLVRVDGSHTGDLDFTGTLSATNGLGLQFNAAAGTYDFTGPTTLNGGGAVININNGSSGTFDFGAGTAVTALASQTAFRSYGSSANVTYRGNLTKTTATGALVEVSEATGGTVTFQTGTLNATAGSGLQFSNSDGTVNFNGNTSLSGGAQVAILGESSGTFTFGTGVAITGGSSTPFVVNNSTPGITYSGNISQGTAGQRLVDLTGVASSPRSILFQTGTLTATNGTGILLSNVDDDVSFNGTTTLSNTVVGADAGVDVSGGSTGAIAFASGASIANPSGIAFHVANGGSATNVTYSGTISTSATAGRPVHVEGVSSGSVDLAGSISSTGQGILVQNNSGGSVNFTGTRTLSTGANTALLLDNNDNASVNLGTAQMTITTTTGAGLRAVNGGAVNVTGTANDVTSGAGTPVAVSDTDVGASGMRFRAVSSSGAANGIFLSNTGNTGGQFRVDGTGSVGSGGTLASSAGGDGSTAGNSVYLNNTRNVVLNSIIFNGSQNFGIKGTTVTNFTLNNSRLIGTHGTNIGEDEAVISITGLAGVGAFTNDSITGGIEDNVRILNHGIVGTAADSIYFDNVRVGHVNAGSGNSGMLVRVADGSNTKVRVRNSFFHGSRGGVMFHLNVVNSATGNLILNNNQFHNTQASISGTGGVLITASGTLGSTPTLSYNITNNSIRGSRSVALNINKDVGTATINGNVSGNTIGQSGVANSGSSEASGIQLRHQGGGTHRATVANNQIFQYNNYGIILEAGDAVAGGGHGRMDMSVTGNTISNPGTLAFPFNGLHANIGTVTDDQHVLCLAATGNSLDASGSSQDIRLRQRMRTTIILPGYGGGASDNTAVNNFVKANNGNGAGLVVVASNSVGVGSPNGPGNGFINGSCNAPIGVP